MMCWNFRAKGISLRFFFFIIKNFDLGPAIFTTSCSTIYPSCKNSCINCMPFVRSCAVIKLDRLVGTDRFRFFDAHNLFGSDRRPVDRHNLCSIFISYSAAVGLSTKLKVPPVTAAADTTTTMSSPRSVEFLPRRLKSIAVSAPKTKRAKHIIMPPEPEPIVTCTNLQDLPDDLLAHVLAFLPPDADRPLRTECAAVVVSQVSKSLRILALSNTTWVGICIPRWKSKVGFASRLANAQLCARRRLLSWPSWPRTIGSWDRR